MATATVKFSDHRMSTDLVKLREHRRARGFSMRRLGDASGIHYLTVHRIEHRKCERVEYTTLERLAAALDTTVSGLVVPPLAPEQPSA